MKRYKTYLNKKELIYKMVSKNATVLDVGFWGQGTSVKDSNWPHRFLLSSAKDVYGIDLDYDESQLPQEARYYKKSSAELFQFDQLFDVIFAGDVIEHFSNPGSFLHSCQKNLKEDGKIIITTPNCFNLFNLTEKLSKYEPTVNSDHTMYFNSKTLAKLLEKNGLRIEAIAYVYTLDLHHKESLKKKFLNIIYYLLSLVTDKFMETLVIIAVKEKK